MARIQNTFCSLPNLAAQPTQNVPTTNTTCVSTRSKSPSSFLKTALRASTSCSMSATVGEAVGYSVFIGYSGQPLDHIRPHFGNDFVGRVIRFEHDRTGSRFQLSLVILHAFGWIELIARTGEMKHIRLRRLIQRACFPVARNAAADPDDSAQTIRICKSKAIIERARLREAEQKHTRRIGNSFVRQDVD